MNFLIIISVVAVFIVNYKFIDTIYKIADTPGKNSIKSKKIVNENRKKALLIGDEPLCSEISDLLFQYDISPEIMYDINKLDQFYQYDYLVAVKSSDLDNLMLCSIGLKMMEIKFVLALCNKQYNKKIYEDNQIPYLIGSSLTSSDFVYQLLNISNSKES